MSKQIKNNNKYISGKEERRDVKEIKKDLEDFLIIRDCSSVNGNGYIDDAIASTSASTQQNSLSLITSNDKNTNESDSTTKSDKNQLIFGDEKISKKIKFHVAGDINLCKSETATDYLKDNGDEDYQNEGHDDGDNEDIEVDYDKDDKDEDKESIERDEQNDAVCENDQKKKVIRPRYKKECNECGKTVDFKYYATHMRIHANEKIYMCSKCGELYASRKSCLRHEKKPHDKNYIKSNSCKICKKKFVSQGALRVHQKEHSLEERSIFLCQLCGKKLATEKYLKTHVHAHDWRRKPQCCETCNKSGVHVCQMAKKDTTTFNNVAEIPEEKDCTNPDSAGTIDEEYDIILKSDDAGEYKN